MPPVMLKIGLAVFVVLAATVTANVLALQPVGRRALAPSPKAAQTVADASGRTDAGTSADGGALAAQDGGEEANLADAIRRELKIRGYAPGEGDLSGYEGRAAILAFESDSGLPLNGTVRPELLQHLLFGVAREAAKPDAVAVSAEVSVEAREVIAAAQRALSKLGYKLDATGLPSIETQRAIREYEAANGLPATGRVSGPLMAKLLGDGRSDKPPAASRLQARVASRR
jgi:peptidoglycan hydrolase-like protein with peptidoglycan-binding domain